MTPADFAVMAREGFGFLEQRSFTYSWNGGYCVRFDSSTVFVSVVYDATRSYELGLELGLQVGVSHDVERPFMISEMLRVAGYPDLGEAASLVQARADAVRSKLEWLGGLLREHGSGFLDGDQVLFEALDEQRDNDCRAYAMRTELANATQEAGRAWREGQYDEVVQRLDPLEKYLSASEQERLKIARKRSQSN